MNAQTAEDNGFPRLAAWMRQAEECWESGKGRKERELTLVGRWDYWGKLSAQFPIAPLRVVYTTSGTLPASAVIHDDHAVVDTKLYYAAVSGLDEARTWPLRSTARRRRSARRRCSRGGSGERATSTSGFLMLPIPRFDAENALHLELAALAADAERIAGEVELPKRAGFVKARQIIRAALAADGVAQRIDARVAQLLG